MHPTPATASSDSSSSPAPSLEAIANAFLTDLATRAPFETATRAFCQQLAAHVSADALWLLLPETWDELVSLPAPPIHASPEGAPSSMLAPSGPYLIQCQSNEALDAPPQWSCFVLQALVGDVSSQSGEASIPQKAAMPLLIADLEQDARLPLSVRSYLLAQRVGALAIAPLSDLGASMGAGCLLALSHQPRPWPQYEANRWHSIAQTLSVGLSFGFQALERERTRRRERLVGRILGYLNQTFDLASTLGLACKDIAQALDADRCLILQYDACDEALVVQEMGQFCASAALEPVQREDLPEEAILYSLNNLVLAAQPDERARDQLAAFHARYGVQSATAVQMMFRGAPMGMIVAQQCRRPRVWSEEDMALLHTLAMELGGAFYLAELYRRAQQSAAEAALSASQKNQALASLTHEFRSPLHTILSCADLMADGPLAERPEKRREYVGLIQKSAQHLLGLLNDILDQARIEIGRFSIRAQTFDLQALLDDAVEMVRPQCDQKGLTLRVEMPRPLPASYVGDPLRLRQALINLLGNACQYTPEGGEIAVYARFHPKAPDSPRLKDTDQCVSIHICDTGCGLSPEEAQNVFRPFYQANPTHVGARKGLGLGLNIAKTIIDLHGAALSLHLRPEGGVEAIVTLPLCGATHASFKALRDLPPPTL